MVVVHEYIEEERERKIEEIEDANDATLFFYSFRII